MTPAGGAPAAGVLALALAWAVLVVAGAWLVRPAPGRVRRLGPAGAAGAVRTPAAAPMVRGSGPGGALGAAAERVGAAVLGVRRRPAAPGSERRVGAALLAALAVVPLAPPAAPLVGLMVWAWPGLAARRAERRRLAALAADVPDVVDLLVLAVGSGLTVHLALARVAARAPGPLAAELARICVEAGTGRRLADALDDAPARAGEAVRPLVQALVAAERYGAPLSTGLERLAGELRRDRRRRAEEAARKVPVKLLFPLVTCTLPAFALLTVAPLVASGIRSLSF